MMRKWIGRGIVLILVFVISLAMTAYLQNSAFTDDRQTMNAPTMAEVMLEFDGEAANRMCGYAQPMQTEFIRDCITPLDTKKELTFLINPYDTKVSSLAYEIRTPDGLRVLENRKIKTLIQEDVYLRTTVEIVSDLRVNQEYSMQITLETDHGPAYYYTRIISRANLNTVNYLRFTRNFVEKCLNKQTADELVDYLETTATNDFTNFSNIDIHSTMRQISWGFLSPSMYSRGIPVIKDINETTCSISMEYMLNAVNENNTQEMYNVTEFYRLRMYEGKIYLLDFNRSAQQVLTADASSMTAQGLILGVRDRVVDYVTSEEAGVTVFVQAGDLWSFSPGDGKLTRIFTFRRDVGADFRDLRTEHDIQITRVYDNGDVDFVVYGYMNRGEREGMSGVCVYHFFNDRNVIEERVFIPSTESYDFLRRDLGTLAYVSTDGRLFILFAGKLYQINIEEGSFSIVEDGVNPTEFAVSRSHAYAAWVIQTGEEAGGIRLIEFETMKTRTHMPEEGKQLRLMGFMNEDTILGILNTGDIISDTDGHVKEGLTAISFEDFDGNEKKRYTPKAGHYITDYELSPMLLEFSLCQKSQNAYQFVQKDIILNNIKRAEDTVAIEMESDDRTGTNVRLAFTNDILPAMPLVLYAKMKKPTDRTIQLQPQSIEQDMYFVYAKGRMMGTYLDPARAVQAADNQLGVVLNRWQQYVWERGNKKTQTQLTVEDIPAVIRSGTTDRALIAQETGDEGFILDLSGCTLDSVLYEVSTGRPIIAVFPRRKLW